MTVAIPINTIALLPGSHLLIPSVTWEQYEELLTELGEKRSSRIAYSQGTLEIMVPLPEHERAIVVISDLVKGILRMQRRPWESLRSSTFKQINLAGVEPDDCFYIQNYAAVIGKDRIDLAIDPPPDLAIESDVTSKTRTDAYLAIAVPELWIYDAGQFRIYLLEAQDYIESAGSGIFPDLPIADLIPKTIERAKQIGSSQALWEFEDWLRQRDR